MTIDSFLKKIAIAGIALVLISPSVVEYIEAGNHKTEMQMKEQQCSVIEGNVLYYAGYPGRKLYYLLND